jgi:hypothetical protein
MSRTRSVSIATGGNGVDHGSGPRASGPTCSTKGCFAPAGTSGVCRRCYQRGWFSANKKKILAERRRIRRVCRTDEPRATAMYIAKQALSAAQATEERLTAVMTQFGMNAPRLPRDAPSVRGLIDEIQYPLAYEHAIKPHIVRYFGGVLFAIDETYLEAVGLLLKSKQPWIPFDQFAHGLERMIHRDGAEALGLSDDLRLAVKYFSTARAHFRRVSYMLCRRMHGSRIADELFEERPSPVNELAALLA